MQLYSVLALARARTCMVRKLLTDREAGRASTAAKHAQNELAKGAHLAHDLGRARRDWEAVFAAMEGEAAEVWEQCEKERKYVYSQQVRPRRVKTVCAYAACKARGPCLRYVTLYSVSASELC